MKFCFLIAAIIFSLHGSAQGLYQQIIRDTFDFKSLQGAPLYKIYAQIKSVKVVYRVADSSIYYISSDRYKYHYDFCAERLKVKQDINTFNTQNYYQTAGREFVLFNVNYTEACGYYIDFVPEDRVSIYYLQLVLRKLKSSFLLSQQIAVLNNNSYIQKMEFDGLHKVEPVTLFSNQKYQCLYPGKVKAKIRFIENVKQAFSTVQADEIIVVSGAPLILPKCKAILCDQLQTPLSHINVMANSKQLPSAYIKNVFELYKSKYHLKYVELVITADSFAIQILDTVPILAQGELRKIRFASNLKYKNLLELSSPVVPRKAVGNKAAYLAQLMRIQTQNKSAFQVPKHACAIPFYFYQQHVQQTPIRQAIAQLIGLRNDDSIKRQLKLIRTLIKQQALNPGLLKMLKVHCIKYKQYSLRFRSSANAEDVAGFSAAGLFDSETGKLNDSVKSFERAIKKVWASVFTYEAYTEFKSAGIDINSVKMGVLVHPNFGDESANGVLVSKNLVRADFPGFTINVQKGEISVVQPDSGVFCDQLICYAGREFSEADTSVVVQYITIGNQNQQQAVLNSHQIEQLYKAAEVIKNWFFYNQYFSDASEQAENYYSYALDIEFKFVGNELYIKQVRPYH